LEPLKQCVILNPNAGSAQSLEQQLQGLGPHSLFETKLPGDAGRLARQALAEGFDRVIAAGGDGTLNEVLNGLSEGFGRVQLGLLPLGTANDFARSIYGSPDLEPAIAALTAGRTKMLDVVRVLICDEPQPRYFINVAAGGFSTLVDENLDKETKSFWGALSYAWTALKTLPDLEEYHLRIAFDDEQPLEVSAYNVVVANARYVGGNILVAPRAEMDDGLLDVVLFNAVGLARLTTLVPKALVGGHLDDEDVVFRQARRFVVSSEPAFDLNTDGEVVGACPATFEVLPKAIEVVVGDV
jgi:diacylglycerol kinase (ATP)